MADEELQFDLDTVTPRMLVEFMAHTGVNLLSLVNASGELDMADIAALDPKVLAGIVWLSLKMSGHPDATFDEALDVPLASLVGIVASEPPDPS